MHVHVHTRVPNMEAKDNLENRSLMSRHHGVYYQVTLDQKMVSSCTDLER